MLCIMLLGRSGGPIGFASISVSDSQIDSNGESYIPLVYDFPRGTVNSINENSALVKPFRRILAKEDGKPCGKVVFAFYQEGDYEYFVLGSFVKTLGGQILFFPGMTFSRIIHTIDGRDLEHDELH